MKNYSLWLDGIDNSSFSKLEKDMNVDVLIIGGGLTGISTFYHLLNSNLNVLLVERNKVGEGVSSKTTGKLTFLQENIYSKVSNIYSKDVAKMYLDSQKDAIKLVRKIVTDNNIECNFSKQKSYLFATSNIEINNIKKEKEILESFNIKVTENKNLPTNINSFYSFCVDNTAYFHPVKYIKKLATICYKKKGNIYENTNIIKIDKIEDKYICYTENNKIIAKKIVIASHYPFFLFPYLFPIKVHLEKSYISGNISNKFKNISGINSNKDSISFRYHNDIHNYYIYLNGSHNLAFKYNNKDNFNNLLKNSDKANYIWSNTDIITNDNLPLIGELNKNLYIGTGYNTWGMTNGSLAGVIISDLIQDKNNKYKNLFNPKRAMPISTYPNYFLNIFSSAKPFIENKIIKNKGFYSNNVIFTKRNGKDIAIYIDESKKEHIVYNTCPHLKCSLIFNEVERTWDCPCHASRFSIDGKCISGPANKDITYKD